MSSLKKGMKENKLVVVKKVLFYLLLVVIMSWLILSIISIFSYASPISSAPWYTGIVVLSLIYAIPVLVIVSVYLIVLIKVKRLER